MPRTAARGLQGRARPSSPGAGGTGTGGATASPSPSAASTGAASTLEQQYEQVVARVLPSVVQISTGSGSGSGVVFDAMGDIVTNAHVVGSATALQVSPASGGKPLTAEVVGVLAMGNPLGLTGTVTERWPPPARS